jgi:hypothetical protein
MKKMVEMNSSAEYKGGIFLRLKEEEVVVAVVQW